MPNDSSNLKKGILTVFLVNIINLVFKLLTNFLMPKYLNVDPYADFKYFQMLVMYIGILHFGFIDGVYLQIGGKKLKEVSMNTLGKAKYSLLITQIVSSVICVIIALLVKDNIVLTTCVLIIPTQIITLYKYIYQATGEFGSYGKIMNANTILLFVLEMILLSIGVQNVYYYIGAYILTTMIVWLYLDAKTTCKLVKASLKEVLDISSTYISAGIFIMLGNFANTFLTSMDRWFIKALMDKVSFAEYSFSVSIVSFLSVAVTPFSVTLYNYFCKHTDNSSVNRIRNRIYLFSVCIISAAFPAKFILEHFIQNYIGSIGSMFYLFLAQSVSIIIACVYVNLYKAKKMQRRYSIKMGIMIIVGLVSNIVFYLFLHSSLSFAIATFSTTVIWYIIILNDFKDYKTNFLSQFYLIIELLAFLTCGLYLDSIKGFLTYIVITVVMSMLIFKDDTKGILSDVRSIIKSK